MPPRSYAPIAVKTEMGKHGYWIVTLSLNPTDRVSVMICKTGITPAEATAMGLGLAPLIPAKGSIT